MTFIIFGEDKDNKCKFIGEKAAVLGFETMPLGIVNL